MQKFEINKGWDFYEANEGNAFIFGVKDARKVDLPHDFIIHKPRSADAAGAADTGYFGEGEGVYRRDLDILPQWEDKTVLLDVDGAYMLAEVAVNREVLAVRPNGYIPFQVDISQALRFDGRKNSVKIITQSRQPSSRWYSGGGLYRSVCLWVGNKLHIKPWDIFVTTPDVTQDTAVVRFQYALSQNPDNYSAHRIRIKAEILDACGHVVTEKVTENREEVTLTVKNPVLWDLDHPYLYQYRVSVILDQETVDVSQDDFGIRSISADAVKGFCLNGRPMKLKGGCLHHDNGLLGGCSYESAELRKIKKLKELGYNTVRISHNPPSLTLLRVCDRLGMLLMDEAFDAWKLGKKPLDYHLYFEEWWERDIECMVKRDRNHPCVITYSIGNEINESNGKNNGPLWAKRLSEAVRKLDSTRFVTSAICGVFPDLDEGVAFNNIDANLFAGERAKFGEQTKAYCEPLDIVGLNYLYDIYEDLHRQFPGRVMIGAESHSFNTYDYWQAVEKNPYVIGDCIWAAVDYLGEVGGGRVTWENDEDAHAFFNAPYPWRTSWQSDIDLTGEQRPQSVYREIMWGHTDKCGIFTTHPKHYGEQFFGTGWHWPDVNDCWFFPEEYVGKMVKVDVYGAGDEAELVLNGRSLGTVAIERLAATMDVPYEKGTLEAIVKKDGEVISRAKIETTGEFAGLVLEPEETMPETRSTMCGAGEDVPGTRSSVPEGKVSVSGKGDLVYVRVCAVDSLGRRIMDCEEEIQVSVSGAGQFLVTGSGNPCSFDQIGEAKCHLYRGTAIIIGKVLGKGKVTVKAWSRDFWDATEIEV